MAAAEGNRKRTRADIFVPLAYKYVTSIAKDSVTVHTFEHDNYISSKVALVRTLLCTSGYVHDSSLIDLCEFICKHNGTSVVKTVGPYTFQLGVEEIKS
jgi:hypothetical protein